ncbi:MAG: hypothetical protein A2516_11035 [Alphaproteobacteria bacterium RIFOXYD12_FULL_60_8]|nr:MAG: hypothetical protein A2516_11035 [Alphaproteobacteria bacterium RIFOXYD12_FULL_60_8]
MVVVDDNPMVQDALRLCLEGWDVDCIAVSTAAEALAVLRVVERRPDLIFSDYNLNDGQRGDQAIRAIRDVHGKDIPAMMFTGDMTHGNAEVRGKIAAFGIPLLTKPITGRVLKDTIDWLKSRP